MILMSIPFEQRMKRIKELNQEIQKYQKKIEEYQKLIEETQFELDDVMNDIPEDEIAESEGFGIDDDGNWAPRSSDDF